MESIFFSFLDLFQLNQLFLLFFGIFWSSLWYQNLERVEHDIHWGLPACIWISSSSPMLWTLQGQKWITRRCRVAARYITDSIGNWLDCFYLLIEPVTIYGIWKRPCSDVRRHEVYHHKKKHLISMKTKCFVSSCYVFFLTGDSRGDFIEWIQIQIYPWRISITQPPSTHTHTHLLCICLFRTSIYLYWLSSFLSTPPYNHPPSAPPEFVHA